jgi:molybdopterin-guanine dinucleotide biosynthesis protein A
MAGGLSSRMGQDKSSLLFEGKTLRERAFQALKIELGEVFISARRDSPFLADVSRNQPLLFDENSQMGPAAGLLRAYQHDSECNWFTLACDFPLADNESIQYLLSAFKQTRDSASDELIVAYINDSGFPEPLFAIWTPLALQALQTNALAGNLSPLSTLRQLKTQLVPPLQNRWLFNTNTPYDFEQLKAYAPSHN